MRADRSDAQLVVDAAQRVASSAPIARPPVRSWLSRWLRCSEPTIALPRPVQRLAAGVPTSHGHPRVVPGRPRDRGTGADSGPIEVTVASAATA